MPHMTRIADALRAMGGATIAQRLALIEALEDSLGAPRVLLSPAEVAERRGAGKRTVHDSILAGRLRPRVVTGQSGSRPAYGLSEADADEWAPRPVGQPRRA